MITLIAIIVIVLVIASGRGRRHPAPTRKFKPNSESPIPQVQFAELYENANILKATLKANLMSGGITAEEYADQLITISRCEVQLQRLEDQNKELKNVKSKSPRD